MRKLKNKGILSILQEWTNKGTILNLSLTQVNESLFNFSGKKYGLNVISRKEKSRVHP